MFQILISEQMQTLAFKNEDQDFKMTTVINLA